MAGHPPGLPPPGRVLSLDADVQTAAPSLQRARGLPPLRGGGGDGRTVMVRGTAAAAAVAVSTATAVTRFPRDILPPTSDEWEAKKALIKFLYLDQGLKLSEVQQVMETQHGFKATERMYKGRFNKWGFRKNLRRPDLNRMRTPLSSRNSTSGMSSPGPSIDMSLLDIRRASASFGMAPVSSNTVSAARPLLHLLTIPSPTAILHPSLESQMREEIFLSINNVASIFYDCPRPRGPERFAIANFISLTRRGLQEIGLKNQLSFGGRMLNRASSLLGDLCLCRNPPNIINICFVLPALMIRLGQRDLFTSYLANLAQVARTKEPDSPLHQIASRLGRLLAAGIRENDEMTTLLLHLSDSSIAIYLGRERSSRGAGRSVVAGLQPWDAFPNSESDLMLSIESVHTVPTRRFVMVE